MDTPSIALVVVTKNLDTQNAVYGAVQNFIEVYDEGVEEISIIGPSKIDINEENINSIPVQRSFTHRIGSRIIDYLWYQVKIAKIIYDHRHRYDVVFFHIGGSLLLIPTLLCRILGLRSAIFITGSTRQSYYLKHEKNKTSKAIVQSIGIIETITCSLTTEVISLSESMDVPWIPSLFSTNIMTANFNYIDCDKFDKKKEIDDRNYDVIFVGRFESVKGIENLMYSLPILRNCYPDIRIKIIGDGELRDEIETFVDQNNLSDNVIFTGWIDHEELPSHLNTGCILVMPSESEGVPKTLLEAMACGSIPVATPVGGIPDIITNGKNGFLLPNNEPETIAKKISSILDCDTAEQISDKARFSIKDNHSFKKVREKYLKFLYEGE